LEAASRALIATDRRKDEFLAILAHELRNPVAAIKAGLYMLKKREGTEGVIAVREQMDRQLVHLTRLVDDLLDISRISEGKISLRKARVELAAIVQSAVEASQPGLDAAGHRLTLALPDEAIWLEADLVRMAQVLSNLLSNAAKYTPEGGHIELHGRRAEDRLEISVRDNGLGISAEMQARVFDIFHQVNAHQERSDGGLGIGLALVRQLVELHGGSVAVASDGPGTGSTFTVTIPLPQ
jgi:signal transduction histidine kinase